MLLQSLASLFLNFSFAFLKISSGGAFPPPLTPAKEREYFLKYMDGDRGARDVLIERNLRLVAHIVKKYYTSHKEQDDLISIGTIGLIKAIDSYNINNGTKFATYASTCVKNEILMYFRSVKKIKCETSIYDSIDVDKDGNALTYIELISCEDTIADDIDTKIKSAQARKAIEKELTEREKDIIIMRYGLQNSKIKTQKEVSEILNISRSYVSRLEKQALQKISKSID